MADNDIKKDETELEDDLSPEDEKIDPEDDKALSEDNGSSNNTSSQSASSTLQQPSQTQSQDQIATAQAPQTEQVQPQQAPTPVQQSYVNAAGTTPPMQNALQRTAEDMAFADDLNKGRIAPKTYQSMFANESTLGKIGTFFGLMLSGAGSGLAHQPNALLDMMNKELDRDLEAQKTNQANKLHWYNAALQHEMNLANIDLIQSQANAQNASAWHTGEQAEFQRIKNKGSENYKESPSLEAIKKSGLESSKQIEKENKNRLAPLNDFIKSNANTVTKNKMLITGAHYLQTAVNNMAPGGTKDLGQQFVSNKVNPTVAAQVHQNNVEQAQKNAVFHATNPISLKESSTNSDLQTQDQKNSDLIQNPVDEKKFKQAVFNGQNQITTTPNYLTEADRPYEQSQQVKNNRIAAQHYVNVVKALDALSNEGQLPAVGTVSKALGAALTAIGGVTKGIPGTLGGAVGGAFLAKAGDNIETYFQRVRSALIQGLSSKLTDMNPEDKDALTGSLLPQWTDNAEKKKALFNAAMDTFHSHENHVASKLRNLGMVKEFPKFEYNPKENKPQPDQKIKSPSFLDMVQSGIQPDDL